MEAVERNLPSTEIAESDRKLRNSFRRWYEKLASLCEKKLIPGWADKTDQNLDNWPFY